MYFPCHDYEPSSRLLLCNFSRVTLNLADSGWLLLLKLELMSPFSFHKGILQWTQSTLHLWMISGSSKQAALSLTGSEEPKPEIIPNSAFWALFLCPASEFSSCISVATCAYSLSWIFFFNTLLLSSLYPHPSYLQLPPLWRFQVLTALSAACAEQLRVFCPSVISGLTKQSVSLKVVLSAGEDAVAWSTSSPLPRSMNCCWGRNSCPSGPISE